MEATSSGRGVGRAVQEGDVTEKNLSGDVLVHSEDDERIVMVLDAHFLVLNVPSWSCWEVGEIRESNLSFNHFGAYRRITG